MEKIKLWAIIDIKEDVFCYENKTNGAMAIYDKKPKIERAWKPFKKVVKVEIKLTNK